MWSEGPSPCYSQNQIVCVCVCIYIYIYMPSFRFVAIMVFLARVSFLTFPHFHGNHFPDFLAHVFGWVITYHFPKFQRYPPIGLARIMV